MSYFDQKVSQEIFEKKYCLHGEKSVEEVFSGIAKEISSVENTKELRDTYEKEFYDIMSSGKFIPAGRIMANARPDSRMKNYNNCFAIELEDSMAGIFEALKEDALISKTGGGVGFNISSIRPKGTDISSGGDSSGVISFLKIFDQSAKTIHTGGSRRSAHIAVLNIDHPEIEDFITCKQGDKNKALTQFNISVGMTDDFIDALLVDGDWDLVFGGKVYKTVKASYLYDLMAKNAFEHNEPGIFNLDNVNANSTSRFLYYIDACNPCAEQPLPPYGVCDLGAINLTKFISNPFTSEAKFNYTAFKYAVHLSIRFLDNVLDATEYPLEKIENVSTNERRIGLGFTGYGNMLSMMRMKYGSPESLEFTERIAKDFKFTSYRASVLLAGEKGSFPAYHEDYMSQPFVKSLPKSIRKMMAVDGIRNIACNTVAPTGTTSLSLGNNCSSGIEPAFALEFDRTIRMGSDTDDVITEKVYDYAWLLYQSLPENIGKVVDPPPYFSVVSDIAPVDAIEVQALWQKYIDASISKTHNLKSGTTFEEYKDLFMLAYKKGLKGFTTFNPDGSMKGIFSTDSSVELPADDTHAEKRPDALNCDIHEITVNKKKMIVLVGILNGRPYEAFVTDNPDDVIQLDKHKTGIIHKKKKGEYDLEVVNGSVDILISNISEAFADEYGALSRMVSMSLRHHVPLQFIVDQLLKTKQFIAFEKSVARILKKYIVENEKVMSSEKCPDCGADMQYVEGCKTCGALCGFSVCS